MALKVPSNTANISENQYVRWHGSVDYLDHEIFIIPKGDFPMGDFIEPFFEDRPSTFSSGQTFGGPKTKTAITMQKKSLGMT